MDFEKNNYQEQYGPAKIVIPQSEHANNSLHEQLDPKIWRQFSENWGSLILNQVDAKNMLVALQRQYGERGVLDGIETMRTRRVNSAPHKYLATIVKGGQARKAMKSHGDPEPAEAWGDLHDVAMGFAESAPDWCDVWAAWSASAWTGKFTDWYDDRYGKSLWSPALDYHPVEAGLKRTVRVSL